MSHACFFVVAFLSFVAFSLQDTVDTYEACSKLGKRYPQGCSGLTAELLGKPWQRADDYTRRTQVRSDYSNINYGEIVCFPDFVAVYVGKQGCDCEFVDVNMEGGKAACMNGYGGQTLHTCDY